MALRRRGADAILPRDGDDPAFLEATSLRMPVSQVCDTTTPPTPPAPTAPRATGDASTKPQRVRSPPWRWRCRRDREDGESAASASGEVCAEVNSGRLAGAGWRRARASTPRGRSASSASSRAMAASSAAPVEDDARFRPCIALSTGEDARRLVDGLERELLVHLVLEPCHRARVHAQRIATTQRPPLRCSETTGRGRRRASATAEVDCATFETGSPSGSRPGARQVPAREHGAWRIVEEPPRLQTRRGAGVARGVLRRDRL